MSDFWPQSKAIALVLCSKLTQKLLNLNLIDFDCRLTSDDNERFLANKVRLKIWYFLLTNDPTMTKFDID